MSRPYHLIAMRLSVAFACLVFCSGAAAQVTLDQVQKAMRPFERPSDHIAILRHFYSGDEVRFDDKGNTSAQLGPWTLDGWLRVNRIKLENDSLVLHGHRLLVDFPTKDFEFSLLPPRDVSLVFPLPKDESSLQSLLRSVFFRSDESFLPGLPPIWQTCLLSLQKPPEKPDPNRLKNPPVMKTENGLQFYLPGKGMTPPHKIAMAEPKYNLVAQAGKVEGRVILLAVIGLDGRPADITLQEPLGAGLDEEAVAAVQNWRFTPGVYQGKQVPVQINIEVNFRLGRPLR